VDAADYIVWRTSVGAASIPNRDPNNTGPIGEADYDSWRAQFGMVAGGGAGNIASSSSAVPEPSCWGIIFAGFIALSLHRARTSLSK